MAFWAHGVQTVLPILSTRQGVLDISNYLWRQQHTEK